MMRTLVVDDEPVSRSGLSNILLNNSRIELVGEAYSASTFSKAMSELKPDLVFLDIMLRDTNSLDILNTLETNSLFIITTAYEQHALRSYDLRAVDYLMKPIARERLEAAISRAYTLHISTDTASDSLFLKSEGRYHRFKTDEILFVSGMENYVVVQTLSAKFICKMTLTSMRRLLPARHFLQIHKSYIINMKRVEGIEKQNIYMQSFVLPISRERKPEIYRLLMGMDMNLDL